MASVVPNISTAANIITTFFIVLSFMFYCLYYSVRFYIVILLAKIIIIWKTNKKKAKNYAMIYLFDFDAEDVEMGDALDDF